MGFKQFFKKQSEKPDNIRDIKIEAPKKETGLRFDVEEAIIALEWEAMKETLEAWRDGNWSSFALLADNMRIIFPERAAALKLDDKDIWRSGQQTLEMIKNRQTKNWNLYCYYASLLKLLFSEKSRQIWLDKIHWQQLKSDLERDVLDENWWTFLQDFRMARILFPKETSGFILDDFVWDEVLKQAELFRQEVNWEMFAKYAAHLKILHPKTFLKLKLTKAVWEKMKRNFSNKRVVRINSMTLSDFAVAMKILAARKAELTENGLKLMMDEPEDFREEREPMPVRLSFNRTPPSRSLLGKEGE